MLCGVMFSSPHTKSLYVNSPQVVLTALTVSRHKHQLLTGLPHETVRVGGHMSSTSVLHTGATQTWRELHSVAQDRLHCQRGGKRQQNKELIVLTLLVQYVTLLLGRTA